MRDHAEDNYKWTYSFLFTQPYSGWSQPSFEQVDHSTQKELDRIASIDNQVDLMDRYPDAEAMIDRLKKDFLS